MRFGIPIFGSIFKFLGDLVVPGTFYAGGDINSESLKVSPVTGAVNHITIKGSVTTLDCVISAEGTDADIGIALAPKGNGEVYTNSDIFIGTPGKGLQIRNGANARIGTTTLVAGVGATPNTSVTANSIILLTVQQVGGSQGMLSVAKNVGVNFVINSTDIGDTSTVGWMIVESLP
jgi:hypothetical protein